MKKTLAGFILSVQVVSAQNIAQKLDKVTKDLMDSSGTISSNLSFYVSDENGNFIYEYQEAKGFLQLLPRKSLLQELPLKFWEKSIPILLHQAIREAYQPVP